MYCPNCGSRINEQAKFCDMCGTKIEEVHEGPSDTERTTGKKEKIHESRPLSQSLLGKVKQITGHAMFSENLSQSPGSRPMAARIIAAVILIVLLCTGISKFMNSNYTKPLDEIIHLVERQETDFNQYLKAAQPECLSDAFKEWDQIMKDVNDYQDWKIYNQTIQYELESYLDSLELSCGRGYKISYVIDSNSQMNGAELRAARESLRQLRFELGAIQEGGAEYEEMISVLPASKQKKFDNVTEKLVSDLSELEITDGYNLSIDIKTEGKMGSVRNYGTLSVVNINHKWCVSSYSGSFDPLWLTGLY